MKNQINIFTFKILFKRVRILLVIHKLILLIYLNYASNNCYNCIFLSYELRHRFMFFAARK